jgi:hypothetical protein
MRTAMPVTRSSTCWLQHRMLAGLTIGLTALAIAACSGTNSTTSSGNVLPAHSDVRRATDPSPTPYSYKFVTVDAPGSSTFTRVLGVDDLGQIVGYYGSGTPSDPSHGFSSLVPYTKFKTLNFPLAVNTVATSISGTRIVAGYFEDNSPGHHTFGFIRNRAIWTYYKDFNTPKGPESVNELLGVNDSGIAVGFYKDSYGNDIPYELAGGHYETLHPPGAVTAMATGINKPGDIMGTETLASGVTEGWILRNGTYTPFSYSGAISTQAFAINYQEQVAGSYTDTAGTHGYILTKVGSPSGQIWQSIDEPNAAGVTVVTSINDHHTITGWYVDASGHTNGFVATSPQ